MEGNIVFTQLTPNPLACKYVFDKILAEGDESFDHISEKNPIWVNELLEIHGVQSVYIVHNFVTVERKEGIEWFEIDIEIKQILKKASASLHQGEKKSFEPALEEIQLWLEKFINPLTHKDGGVFEVDSLENQTLFLTPKGACRSCPFVNMTIKKGIEENIKSYFPQIQEVWSK